MDTSTDLMWYIVISVGVFVMSIYLCSHCKKIEYHTRYRVETNERPQHS